MILIAFSNDGRYVISIGKLFDNNYNDVDNNDESDDNDDADDNYNHDDYND